MVFFVVGEVPSDVRLSIPQTTFQDVMEVPVVVPISSVPVAGGEMCFEDKVELESLVVIVLVSTITVTSTFSGITREFYVVEFGSFIQVLF